MYYPRYSLLALGLWLSIGSLSAETVKYITLGTAKVHPTRILAKYKDESSVALQSKATTLSAIGVAQTRSFELIPGLVVLDSQPGVALQSVQALDPQLQADDLAKRIAALEASGLFEYVQPNYVYTNRLVPSDPAFTDGTLWGLRNDGKNGGVIGADIDAERAWDITTGTNSVIVAVVDSGVRYTHVDLAGQMWRNPSENGNNGVDDDGDGIVDDVFGMNATDGSGNPMDDFGHGTHVAGTIGAMANGGGSSVGVAWNIQIMACKAFDATGFTTSDWLVQCINFAVLKGAKVMNCSWGGGPFDRAMFDAFSAAQKKSVLVVVAAGNDASNNDVFPDYPSTFNLNNIISVAASDRADRFAYFSNFGLTNVDVVAPGVDVFSTWFDSDNSYEVLSGTSMAAPHVTGVAALILSKYPKATLSELRERIISTAVKVPAFRGRVVSEGRVSAYRALNAAADGVMEMSIYPPPGNDLLVGSKVNLYVTVTDLKPVTNATVVATYTVGSVTNTLKFLNDGTPPDAVKGDATYSAELLVPEIPGDLLLNLLITAAGKTNLAETVVYHIAHRPPNDNFEEASKVPSTGGLVLGTNRFATLQLGEPKHAQVATVDASVWWNWSPAVSGNAIVDTAGSAFDTVLAVYTNSTLRTLREIASVNDVGPNGSQLQGYVQFDALKGVTYHIVVAGMNSDEVGAIRLRVEPGGKPDTNAPTVIVSEPSSGVVVTNLDAKVVIKGVAFDPQPNASGVKEVFVQVNNGLADKAFGTTNWASTNLLVRGNNTVRVVAADFAGNRSDAVVLTVRYAPVSSPNDLFFNAIQLTGSNGTVSGSSTNATKELNEPFHAGNQGGKSLWWYFRAPSDGALALSTISATFDTLLAVYTGTRVDNLTPLNSNDDAFDGSGYSQLTQAVTAGQLYYIAVDGFAGQSGTVHLDYSFSSGGIWRVQIETPDGGSVTPGSGLYPAGTNLVFTAVPGPNQEFEGWAGTTTSSENPLTIQATSDVTLVAHFRTHEPADGFESGGLGSLPWVTSGDAPWIVQSGTASSGQFAARSGVIGNGQSSSLKLTDLVLPAGQASFDFLVSSEANWDFLEFYLNGRRLDRWSGEVGWLTFLFDVPAGPTTLEWRYVKDPVNTSKGQDAAFIDNVELPKQATAATSPASVHLERLDDGRVQLSVQGQGNQAYIIQVSSDLVRWDNLSSAQAAGSVTKMTDLTPASQQTRFYRVISVGGN